MFEALININFTGTWLPKLGHPNHLNGLVHRAELSSRINIDAGKLRIGQLPAGLGVLRRARQNPVDDRRAGVRLRSWRLWLGCVFWDSQHQPSFSFIPDQLGGAIRKTFVTELLFAHNCFHLFRSLVSGMQDTRGSAAETASSAYSRTGTATSVPSQAVQA